MFTPEKPHDVQVQLEPIQRVGLYRRRCLARLGLAIARNRRCRRGLGLPTGLPSTLRLCIGFLSIATAVLSRHRYNLLGTDCPHATPLQAATANVRVRSLRRTWLCRGPAQRTWACPWPAPCAACVNTALARFARQV